MEGELIYHPKYGEQFQFQTVTKIRPQGKAAIIGYLSSGLIPHVGKVTAKRIVETFGDETLDIIEEQPERLKEVEGIGKKKLAIMLESLEKQRDMRNFLLDAASFDLSSKEALAIYKVFGDGAMDIVEKDPYRLVGQVRGMGFLKADAIAEKVGVARDDGMRMVAGMKHILSRAVSDGHTYLPKGELIADSAKLLTVSEEFLEDYFTRLAIDPEIYIVDRQGVKVYFLNYYRAETFVAEALKKRGKVDLAEHMAEDMVSAVSENLSMELAEKQREALKRAVDSNPVSYTHLRAHET